MPKKLHIFMKRKRFLHELATLRYGNFIKTSGAEHIKFVGESSKYMPFTVRDGREIMPNKWVKIAKEYLLVLQGFL